MRNLYEILENTGKALQKSRVNLDDALKESHDAGGYTTSLGEITRNYREQIRQVPDPDLDIGEEVVRFIDEKVVAHMGPEIRTEEVTEEQIPFINGARLGCVSSLYTSIIEEIVLRKISAPIPRADLRILIFGYGDELKKAVQNASPEYITALNEQFFENLYKSYESKVEKLEAIKRELTDEGKGLSEMTGHAFRMIRLGDLRGVKDGRVVINCLREHTK